MEQKQLISQLPVRNLVYTLEIETVDDKGEVEIVTQSDDAWAGIWKKAQIARQRGDRATIGHVWRIGR